MSRVPEGTRWIFAYPRKKPRLIAIAVVRHQRLVIERAVDLASGGRDIGGAIGSQHDRPSPACRAVDPAHEYNGWIQWRWSGDLVTTLDDVERGRVLLPNDEASDVIRWPNDAAAWAHDWFGRARPQAFRWGNAAGVIVDSPWVPLQMDIGTVGIPNLRRKAK